jgi:hypothetical protein
MVRVIAVIKIKPSKQGMVAQEMPQSASIVASNILPV